MIKTIFFIEIILVLFVRCNLGPILTPKEKDNVSKIKDSS